MKKLFKFLITLSVFSFLIFSYSAIATDSTYAQFIGKVAGMTSTITISAKAPGSAGNATLIANGTSIDDLINAWNANKLGYAGDGSQIPTGNITLTGGSNGGSSSSTNSDISALTAAKTTAQGLIDANAHESASPGDHMVGSRADLVTALTAANATIASFQGVIDQQTDDLNTAINIYNSSIVPQNFITIPGATLNTIPVVTGTITNPNTSANSSSGSANGLIPCGTTANPTPCGGSSGWNQLMQLINNVVNFILFRLVVPIAAIMFAYAGFELLTAGGEVSKMSKAKKIFMNVAIGLIIAAAAWLIVHTVLQIVGYNGAWIGL